MPNSGQEKQTFTEGNTHFYEEVVEGTQKDRCKNCCFHGCGAEKCEKVQQVRQCASARRQDGKNVVFKQVY